MESETGRSLCAWSEEFPLNRSFNFLADREAVLGAGMQIRDGIGQFLHEKNTEPSDRPLGSGRGEVGSFLLERIVRDAAVTKDKSQSIALRVQGELYCHCTYAVSVGIVGNVNENLFDDHVKIEERARAAGDGRKKRVDPFLRHGIILCCGLKGEGISTLGGGVIEWHVFAHKTVPFECLMAAEIFLLIFGYIVIILQFT